MKLYGLTGYSHSSPADLPAIHHAVSTTQCSPNILFNSHWRCLIVDAPSLPHSVGTLPLNLTSFFNVIRLQSEVGVFFWKCLPKLQRWAVFYLRQCLHRDANKAPNMPPTNSAQQCPSNPPVKLSLWLSIHVTIVQLLHTRTLVTPVHFEFIRTLFMPGCQGTIKVHMRRFKDLDQKFRIQAMNSCSNPRRVSTSSVSLGYKDYPLFRHRLALAVSARLTYNF